MILAALLLAAAAPSADERELAGAINAYREQHGLPAVPLSPALMRVARVHVRDLEVNAPDDATGGGPGECTMHSWSARGPWTPVCYTRDARAAPLMWSKPREITRGAYAGDGFEIAFWWSGEATPTLALDSWQHSAGHNAVIRERGAWARSEWQAMGVAVEGHYAVVWFGKLRDPAR